MALVFAQCALPLAALLCANGARFHRRFVIPYPSHSCDALQVERIPRDKALLYLMAYPRIQEFARREPLQRRLDFLGRIAASVPLFEAEIPWGLPDPRALAALLAEGVGITPRVS